MKKKYLGVVTVVIILAVAAIAYFALTKQQAGTSVDIAKCIGKNSILYVQYGCSHCKTQEEMFGDNVKYLNMIDCFYTPENCSEITATPTWVINNQKYIGTKSIQDLQNLTNC
jgi:hypothetical protein